MWPAASVLWFAALLTFGVTPVAGCTGARPRSVAPASDAGWTSAEAGFVCDGTSAGLACCGVVGGGVACCDVFGCALVDDGCVDGMVPGFVLTGRDEGAGAVAGVVDWANAAGVAARKIRASKGRMVSSVGARAWARCLRP